MTHYLLHNAHKYLQGDQTLYLAGGFDEPITDTSWYVKNDNQPQPDPKYNSNAEETDTRLWVHVKQNIHEYLYYHLIQMSII